MTAKASSTVVGATAVAADAGAGGAGVTAAVVNKAVPVGEIFRRPSTLHPRAASFAAAMTIAASSAAMTIGARKVRAVRPRRQPTFPRKRSFFLANRSPSIVTRRQLLQQRLPLSNRSPEAIHQSVKEPLHAPQVLSRLPPPALPAFLAAFRVVCLVGSWPKVRLSLARNPLPKHLPRKPNPHLLLPYKNLSRRAMVPN